MVMRRYFPSVRVLIRVVAVAPFRSSSLFLSMSRFPRGLAP